MAMVLAVDAVALAVYFAAGLAHAAPATRLAFTAGWTVATLVVVLVGLTRIRRARLWRRGDPVYRSETPRSGAEA